MEIVNHVELDVHNVVNIGMKQMKHLKLIVMIVMLLIVQYVTQIIQIFVKFVMINSKHQQIKTLAYNYVIQMNIHHMNSIKMVMLFVNHVLGVQLVSSIFGLINNLV